MCWGGIRDMAVWLTLYDYHGHHDLWSHFMVLGDIYMHCEGFLHQSFCLVGGPIKVDKGCMFSIIHISSSWLGRGVRL